MEGHLCVQYKYMVCVSNWCQPKCKGTLNARWFHWVTNSPTALNVPQHLKTQGGSELRTRPSSSASMSRQPWQSRAKRTWNRKRQALCRCSRTHLACDVVLISTLVWLVWLLRLLLFSVCSSVPAKFSSTLTCLHTCLPSPSTPFGHFPASSTTWLCSTYRLAWTLFPLVKYKYLCILTLFATLLLFLDNYLAGLIFWITCCLSTQRGNKSIEHALNQVIQLTDSPT